MAEPVLKLLKSVSYEQPNDNHFSTAVIYSSAQRKRHSEVHRVASLQNQDLL
jgi:hypothetical protein